MIFNLHPQAQMIGDLRVNHLRFSVYQQAERSLENLKALIF